MKVLLISSSWLCPAWNERLRYALHSVPFVRVSSATGSLNILFWFEPWYFATKNNWKDPEVKSFQLLDLDVQFPTTRQLLHGNNTRQYLHGNNLHLVSNFPFTAIYISCLICGSSNQINNNNEQLDCQNADSCDCTCRCISQKEIVNFFWYCFIVDIIL